MSVIFPQIFSRADVIFAHNSAFDEKILKNELYRYELVEYLHEFESKRVRCTMKETRSVVNALSKSGKVKNPTLKELYEHCTGLPMPNQHDALHDVIHLFESLRVLFKQNKIQMK